MAPAWYHLGNAHARLERPDGAVASYRRALEIDPAHGPVYKALSRTLLGQGQEDEALRWWRHGEKVMKLSGSTLP